MKNYLATCLLTLSWTLCIAQSDTLKTKAMQSTKFDRKKQFGGIIGIGTTKFKTSYSDWRQGTVNYNDSLISIKTNSAFKFEFGFVYQIRLTKLLSTRPTYHTAFEGGILEYEKRTSTENVNLTTYSHTLSLPLVFNHNTGNYQPYIMIGPTLLYMMAQQKEGESKLLLSYFDLLGEVGAGVDFYSKTAKCIVSPGLKYSVGFLNGKENTNNTYSNTIDKLQRRSITLSINLRAA